MNQCEIRAFSAGDLEAVTEIWNTIVEEGIAFPQEDRLSPCGMLELIEKQTAVFCAHTQDGLQGFYILHPNNVGRCSHIANAAYAVHENTRGKGIGRALVLHSLEQTKKNGFSGLQFNAVVASNHRALSLYESCGFCKIGCIPKGFRQKDGIISDIYILYRQV